jgi:hypothetical protein
VEAEEEDTVEMETEGGAGAEVEVVSTKAV